MNNKVFLISILTIMFVLLPEFVFAKDVVQSLRTTENKASEILMILGPLSLIVSAAVFQFSKQAGSSMLAASCIGIAVFAGRHGIFNMIFGIFN